MTSCLFLIILLKIGEMKTLCGSYWKFCLSNQREKERVFGCSSLTKLEIGFLLHQKRFTTFSLLPKCVPSISALSSAQTNVENEEIQLVLSDQPKTVSVRFKLNKECAFGQQYLVVGDDPMLGLWDPSESVPLNWSEGHVWVAQVDIPIGKLIKYKFILKGITGAISWQPGPDRVLETWDTGRIISVSEDWDSPDLQNIVEEDDLVDDLNEKILISSDLLVVAEDSNQTLVEEEENAVEELSDKISEDLRLSEVNVITDEKLEETGSLSPPKEETELDLDEGMPVLVPGLVPTSMDENEDEEEVAEIVKNNIIVESTITEYEEQHNGDETTEQSDDASVPAASLHAIESSEMVMDDEKEYGDEQMESDIMGGDVQWGRRTLQKFLANFRFI